MECASAFRLSGNLIDMAAFVAKMTTDRRSMMLTRIGSTISASEGTLAGDILWLAASAFVFSVVIGIVD